MVAMSASTYNVVFNKEPKLVISSIHKNKEEKHGMYPFKVEYVGHAFFVCKLLEAPLI
jgi:hypothetical protein